MVTLMTEKKKIYTHAWNAVCAAIQSLTDLPTPPSVCVPLGKCLPVSALTWLICSCSLVLVFTREWVETVSRIWLAPKSSEHQGLIIVFWCASVRSPLGVSCL